MTFFDSAYLTEFSAYLTKLIYITFVSISMPRNTLSKMTIFTSVILFKKFLPSIREMIYFALLIKNILLWVHLLFFFLYFSIRLSLPSYTKSFFAGPENFCLKSLAISKFFKKNHSVQFSSVAQSCPTLCDPMNRSMPGLPVHHQLPEFTQITSSDKINCSTSNLIKKSTVGRSKLFIGKVAYWIRKKLKL